MIQNDYLSTESDCEKPKKGTGKKRHEKYLKDNRLVDIDEMIDTRAKLNAFIQRILIHKDLLLKIRDQRNYKIFEMSRLIFAKERLYEQISKMDLRRYKKIKNQKTLVKVYQWQLSDEEIWLVLADAIEINNERLKTKPNQKNIDDMEDKAMKNAKFRQFQDHQRIPQDLLQVLKKESGSILNLMNKLEAFNFFEKLSFEPY